MFSQLREILKVHPHRAETSDARLALRHKEQDRDQIDPDQQRASLTEKESDNTVVSVEALKIFLDHYLNNSDDKIAAERSRNRRQADSSDDIKEEEQTGWFEFEGPEGAETFSGRDINQSEFNSDHQRDLLASHAAGLYQSTAKKISEQKTDYLNQSADPSIAPANAPVKGLTKTSDDTLPLALTASERQNIYALIEALESLNENGIKYLQINRGRDFIDSIASAVNEAKRALS